jgi:hypothetical protein
MQKEQGRGLDVYVCHNSKQEDHLEALPRGLNVESCLHMEGKKGPEKHYKVLSGG